MSTFTKPILIAAAALTLATPIYAAGGNNGTGWGVGEVPPGAQKKMEQQKLTNYKRIDNPDKYGLPPAPSNQMYVQKDGEIYRVMRDTATVVAAVGILSELLGGS